MPPPSPLLVMLSLLLATRPVTVDRSVTWRADEPTRARQPELMDYVLRNEQRWRRVLRQRVLLTARNRPPYRADDDAAAADPEVRALLRLVDADATHVTPLPLLQRVARLRWLGSYVEYAAYVTRSAFTCFTCGIARLAVYLVWRMWHDAAAKAVEAATSRAAANAAAAAKASAGTDASAAEKTRNAAAAANAVRAGPEPAVTVDEVVRQGLPANALRELRALLAVMAAKTAAVHGDSTAEADALFGHAFADPPDAGARDDALAAALRRFDEHIDKRCAPISDQDALLNAGVGEGVVKGSITSPQSSVRALAWVYGLVVTHAVETYRAFGVEAVPLAAWAPVMDYDHPVVKSKQYLQPLLRTDPSDAQASGSTPER